MRRDQETIVLDGFMKIGDRVVVQNPTGQEASYIRDPLPDGTVLVCVGFYPYRDYKDFDPLYDKKNKRGVYNRYGAAYFKTLDDDEVIRRYSAHHLVFEDPTIDKESRRGSFFWNMSHEGEWVSELPETEFYIGDQVELTKHANDEVEHYVVTQIYYPHSWDGEISYSLAAMVRRRHSGELQQTWSRSFVPPEQMRLLREGYIRIHCTALKSGIPYVPVFETLAEKAAFYTSLGEYVEVRNPDTELYQWTKEEALNAIRQGIASTLRVGPGIFGTEPRIVVGKFPDVEGLDEELRAATLEGFGLTD